MVNGTIGVLFIKEQSTYLISDLTFIACLYLPVAITAAFYSCELVLGTCVN